MSTEILYLFRIKLLRSPQSTVLRTNSSNQELLINALQAAEERPTKGGGAWHICNFRMLGSQAAYFRVGRTSKGTESKFDGQSNEFVDRRVEVAEYSHAILALDQQVVGISQNARLAQGVEGIAHQLQQTLNTSAQLLNEGIATEIGAISDPTDFIQIVSEAYQVTQFSMEFGRPNPFDADSDFQVPMERLLQSIHGQAGKTTLNAPAGGDLDRETITLLSRSISSTGNNAHVRFRPTPTSRKVTKHLQGNTAHIVSEDLNLEPGQKEAAQKIIAEYLEVRHGSQNH